MCAAESSGIKMKKRTGPRNTLNYMFDPDRMRPHIVGRADSAGAACEPAIDIRKCGCLYSLVQLDRGYGSFDWSTRVRRHVLLAVMTHIINSTRIGGAGRDARNDIPAFQLVYW
jgi:hypothetical protein